MAWTTFMRVHLWIGGPGRPVPWPPRSVGYLIGAAALSAGQTVTQSPFWICLSVWVVGQKLWSFASKVRWPLKVVSAPLLCSASHIFFWSVPPAAVTPAVRICQAFQDAVACVSKTLYGRLAAAARLLKSSTIAVASGGSLARVGLFGSNIDTDSSPSAGGPTASSGPGAG